MATDITHRRRRDDDARPSRQPGRLPRATGRTVSVSIATACITAVTGGKEGGGGGMAGDSHTSEAVVVGALKRSHPGSQEGEPHRRGPDTRGGRGSAEMRVVMELQSRAVI